MKAIADLLRKKESPRNHTGKIDEKTIESVFFEALKKEMLNIGRADISSFKFGDKKISCKTSHPAIASEIWRRRDRLKKEINELFGSEIIKEIKVK